MVGITFRTTTDRIVDTIIVGSMAIFAVVVMYPFVYLLAVSFNEGMDALKGGILFWPRKFTLENYKIIFTDPRLVGAAYMTVLRTVLGTLAGLVCTSLVAYAFTKPRLIGRKLYTIIFILPMYVAAGIIPMYLVFRLYKLTDSFLVYLIPNLTWGYYILIMRTFFEAIPASVEESASLDGASEFTILFRIILPLSAPVIASIALFNAVWHWNYWLDTVMFTRRPELDTLISLLSKMLTEQQSVLISQAAATRRARFLTPQVLRAAMTMVTTIPIVLIYPFLQKYFVKGIMIGSVKE
jgi:putative aldouronate transport system permease protein